MQGMRIRNRALRRLLYTAGSTGVFWPLLRSRATIFMLHRFSSPEIGVKGHDQHMLRRVLAALRRERFDLLPLAAVLEDLATGQVRERPAVAFTIDDGYLDQAMVAAPAFAEFDCPVTTFVTTGFLDRHLWLWWDRIDYVFENTALRSISVPTAGGAGRYEWDDPIGRRAAYNHFTAMCKRLPDGAKGEAIDMLAEAAQVELPINAPLQYAPMSWDDLRHCERMTMAFGPHTVTHPVLSRTSDVQSRYEITESWSRLRAEAVNPVPVWCYPNGQRSDFTEREMRTLADLEFLGAVTGETGYASARAVRSSELERFCIRRFAYPDSVDEVRILAGGAERLKQIVRRES